ncbi:hypothetical protein PsorP6_000773 [Peronosclerospora sorghi]|uniref:Uncharacterized protein n=1 Tax=Peronosclerospora sorghi TaxID=230839 RepID=A0ACC0WRV9_9STRA|nr:hypothetical protein PsorP6_000773 [Peronosclerospora sorghi]
MRSTKHIDDSRVNAQWTNQIGEDEITRSVECLSSIVANNKKYVCLALQISTKRRYNSHERISRISFYTVLPDELPKVDFGKVKEDFHPITLLTRNIQSAHEVAYRAYNMHSHIYVL